MIALCPTNEALLANRAFDDSFISQFPGGRWIPQLRDAAASRGHSVVTGDTAMEMIHRSDVDSRSVLVIQEELSPLGAALLSLGARGFVLMSLESPLFAGHFYRRLPEISNDFAHYVLFNGTREWTADPDRLITARFPSFEPAEVASPKPWDGRRSMVLVSGNKYWKRIGLRPRKIAGRVRDLYRGVAYTEGASAYQLHDARLDVVEYFGRRGLDLYGPNWDDLSNLPRSRRAGIASAAARATPVSFADKTQTLGDYRFTFCIENAEFPGYVTEKIFNALVAGSVPIYLGAPDVGSMIPAHAFVSMRDFSSLSELDEHLTHFSAARADEMLRAGASFLRGPGGRPFSHSGFASEIVALLDNLDIPTDPTD